MRARIILFCSMLAVMRFALIILHACEATAAEQSPEHKLKRANLAFIFCPQRMTLMQVL